MKKSQKKRTFILIAVIAALALLILITCTATVPTGYTGIVTTFGRVENENLEAGFHFKSPVQKIVLMDNREQKAAFMTECFSSDIQQVDVTGSVNYAINKSTAMNLFKEVGTDYYVKLVQPRMLETIKGAFSKYTAENLVANRQTLSTQIREEMADELSDYGINVISINIENIDFTDAFTDAVEAKQVAAQKKLQAQIEEEQKTMEAQQQAERERISAEAKAAVQKINADAEAYAVKVKSEAEAAANEKIAASLTESLIRFTEAKSWNGELPSFVAGDSSAVLPILSFGEGEEENK